VISTCGPTFTGVGVVGGLAVLSGVGFLPAPGSLAGLLRMSFPRVPSSLTILFRIAFPP
jgi:hypothetical protein